MKKYQKVLLSLFLFYSFLGFFLLPYLLKPQLIDVIEKQTNAKISIQNIYFNPYIFKLGITGIKLTNPEGEHLFIMDEISLNLELYSLFNATVHLKELSLKNPKVFAVLHKDKSLNLLSILKENNSTKEDTEETSSMPRIMLDKVSIVDGALEYEDYSKESKFDFVFERIGFELNDVDTNDFNTSDAKLRFYSALGDGGFIDIKTNILGFKPFVIDGSVDFQASKLYTQWRYIKDSLNLEIADGKLTFNTHYHFNLDDLNATSIEGLNLHLNDLRVKPKEQHGDVLNLASLDVSDVTLKPFIQDVKIKQIALDSLSVKVSRDEKGEIDWVKFIEFKSDANTSSTEESNNTKPWNVVLEDLKLTNIKADFYDKGINPQVDTKLNTLNLYAQNITLAGVTPLAYQLDMRLNEKLSCELSGDIKHKILDITSNIKCTDFNLVHYSPYIDDAARKALKKYDLKLISSNINFDTKLFVKKIDDEVAIFTKNTNFNLKDFKLNKKSETQRLVNFQDFAIKNLELNTKNKTLDITKVSLDGVEAKIQRLKNLKLNVEDLVVPKPSKKENKSTQDKPYKITLKHFALKNAITTFRDKSFHPSALQKIDRINLNAYEINSEKNSWLRYTLSAQVNSKGYIKSKGGLRHTPLKQKGSFEIQHISLSDINPYLQEKAYVSIDEGYLNLKAKTQYSQAKKAPNLKVEGSFSVDDLFVEDIRDEKTLLSFNKLGLESFVLEMQPNRLYVDEAVIDSFYVDALIDENKQMNFASLMKNSVAEVSEEESKAPKEEFPFRIMKIDVNNGSAKFADYSIPIKFKTDIHDLNGHIYALSNLKDETSYVEISGEIDKYGATSIKGNLDSDPKQYMDMDVRFKNLNLNSMSGYSATFAGHEIDDGKLFLDLNYKILNSQLQGENSIIVKNIKLGQEYEDENVTSLPLGFVIALLEDTDGVIDIDMPVDGDVDEPDFKYGELLLKTLGNLIVKAVASPFKFLGEAMGINADSLDSLDFKAGEMAISPPEREKLDNITKMMIKRPKISLKINGAYDSILDKRALQLEKLITLVVKKSGIQNRENHESVMGIDLLEDIYEDFRDDDGLEKIQEKLEKEYEGKAFERAYKRELMIATISLQDVSEEELESLAIKRAEVIKNYLVQEKSIEQSRIVLEKIITSEYDEKRLVHTKLEIGVK